MSRKSCVELNKPKLIRDEFELIEGKVLIEQRRLSFSEVSTIERISEDVTDDFEVFQLLNQETDLINENKRITDRIKLKYKKLIDSKQSILDGLVKEDKDISSIENEISEILINMNDEIAEKTKKLPSKVEYQLKFATKKVNKANRDIQTRTIAYTMTPSENYGGYCSVNDKILLNEELCEFIESLDPNKYLELYNNAIKSQNPNLESFEDVKSGQME